MNAKLITTDFENGRYWDVEEVVPGEIDHIRRVSVYPKLERQVFHGFGGVFTEAACCWMLKAAPFDRHTGVLSSGSADFR